MKRQLLILIYLFCTVAALSQEHVFILVDVSASRGADPIKLEAKQQVYDLIMGQYSSNGWIPVSLTDQRIKDLINSPKKQPLISQNSWVCIVPFGDQAKYKSYTIAQNKISPSDFQTFFNSNYPIKFVDNLTYIQIAEAFTASLAKTYSINEYYMFIITDGLGDQDDTNSKNTYDSFEENLLLEWNNASSSIVKNIGSLSKSKYYINLRRVTNVKGSQIPTNPGIQPPSTILNSDLQNPSINITSPSKGRKNKEIELKTKKIQVNWGCTNCPQGIKYTVLITEYDGGNFRETKKDLLSNTASFNVPYGKFKITVMAQNYGAISDTTFVKNTSGGTGLLLILLLFAILGGVGYKIWNNKRKKSSNKGFQEKTFEVFSSSNSVSPNSTNNKHY